MILPRSFKRPKEREWAHLRNMLLKWTVKNYFGYKTAFPA